jgi:two-component system, LuxR family, response regulator FixJ
MSEHSGTVLLVDDDLAVRSSLKFVLELEGLAVRAYASGAELLADPNLPRSGCLVVDFHLPGMNGIELVDRLGERHLRYPVIMITSGMAHDISGSRLIRMSRCSRSRLRTMRSSFASMPRWGTPCRPDPRAAKLHRRQARPNKIPRI